MFSTEMKEEVEVVEGVVLEKRKRVAQEHRKRV
jgi:hypothetical protein